MWVDRDQELEKYESLKKALYEYARIYLEDKLQTGEVTGSYKLGLHSKNAPEACPFNLAEIELNFYNWHNVEVKQKN